MLYKKVKRQIAEQTRKDLGFVKIDSKSGSVFTRKNQHKTNIPNRIEPFIWTSYYYLKNYVVGNDKIFPILYKSIFDEQYPTYQYLKDYYVFWYQTGKYSGVSITQSDIKGESNGSFVLRDLPAFYNGFIMSSFSGDGSKQTYLPISIGSNHITMSVWAQVHHSNSSEFQILYHTGLTGLNDKWIDLSIPIGEVSTDLIILIYNYDNDAQQLLVNDYGKPIKQSLIPESGEIKSDTYLNVSMDISNVTTHSQNTNVLAPYTPTFDASNPIISTVNPITHNVVNKININNNYIFPIDSYNIYRREEKSIKINNWESNRSLSDLIQLDTSNNSLFYGDSKILVGNKEINIHGSFLSKANKISNSDFSSYSGSDLTDWNQGKWLNGLSSASVGTSYSYTGDWMYNGNCARVDAYKTSVNTSIYLWQGYDYSLLVDTSEPEYIRFNWKELSTSHVGRFRMLLYSSTNGTETLNTVIPFEDYSYSINPADSNSWNTFQLKIFNQPTANALLIPSDSKYIGLILFGKFAAGPASSYLFDGVHYGQLGEHYIFSTSTNDKVVAKLFYKYEVDRNHLTGFQTYFENNSKDYTGTKQASHEYGQIRYYSSANAPNQIRFDYGIECLDSATNEFSNPTLYPDTASWNLTKTHYSTISGYSLFSNTGYAHLDVTKGSSGAISSSIDRGSETDWVAAIWAKSPLPEQQFKLTLNCGTILSSAIFTLTTSWARYSLYQSFIDPIYTNINTIIGNVDTNKLYMDIAGIQIAGGLPYCPGFVSTSGGVTGLTYTSSSDILNQECGTIRLWYSPNLDYNTGNDFKVLWQTPSVGDGYYMNLYARKTVGFRFGTYGAGQQGLISFATAYSTGNPIHLVATWDTVRSYLYVNGIRSDSAVTYYCSTPYSSFYVGMNAAVSGYGANGIIQNFRIDKTIWSSADVKQDYLSYKTLFNDSSLTISKDVLIGEQDAHVNADIVTFTDDVGLENNSLYKYTIRGKDNFGNLSPASEVASTHSYRQPFEFNTKNKVANGSFEVLDYNTQFPLYWSSVHISGTLVSTTTHRFMGHRSVYGILGDKLVYEYVSINDTSIPLTISWYNLLYSNFKPVNSFDIEFLDARWKHIGTFSASSALDYQNTTAIGIDGNTWIRYATTISTSLSDYKKSRYWKMSFTNNHSPGMYMIDGIQVEEGTSATEFSEGYFVGEGNLGRNSVGGNAVAFESLIGRHLYAGELIVSGDESDANRIVIGQEDTSHSFALLSSSNFHWHAPGMDTGSGWNYTKHIEQGIGIFGETQSYGSRFYEWLGSPKSPMIIISPQDAITFSTAGLPSTYSLASIYPQKLKYWISSSTPKGFIANAILYEEKASSFTDETIDTLNIENGLIHRDYLKIYDTSDSSTFGATSLSSTSQSIYGSFEYGLSIEAPNLRYPGCLVKLWATSVATSTFDSASWNYITGEYRDVPPKTNPTFTMQFADSAFNNARSITVMLGLEYYNASTFAYLYPHKITYSTSAISVLLKDSAIGKFSWTALDGGTI